MCIKTYATTNIKINKIYRIYKEKYVKIQRVYKRYIKSIQKQKHTHIHTEHTENTKALQLKSVYVSVFEYTLYKLFIYSLYFL